MAVEPNKSNNVDYNILETSQKPNKNDMFYEIEAKMKPEYKINITNINQEMRNEYKSPNISNFTTLTTNIIDEILMGSSTESTSVANELEWQEVILVSLLCIVIVITVIGNTLIILSVLTTRRLRTVTNCFVMSLAVADWLVGIFVMPPAVALHLVGTWELGWVLCDIWISLDVLLCTASILSLCAISVDRYLAVTQPLNYSRRRRSKRLALFMILIVWLLALAITCPPILGWYEPGRRESKICRYNQNKGYVVFSAMGSFFIPMIVMLYVYLKISCVVAARHDQLTEIHNEVHIKSKRFRGEFECDNDTSEADHSSPRRKNFCSSVELRKHSHEPEHVLEYYDIRENCACKSSLETPTKAHCTNGHSYELVSTAQSEFQKSTKTVPLSRSSTISYKHNANNVEVTKQIWRPSSLTMKSNSETSNTDTLKSNKINKTISNRLSSLRRETKTAQTLSIVVGGFIACWLPFFIYYLLTPFLPQRSVKPMLMDFLTWLGWINSAINPFIYAFYSADFRIAFWRLTFRRFCKSSNRSQLAMHHR